MSSSPPVSAGRRTLINAGALTGSNLWRIAVSFLIQILVARRLGLEALGHYTVLMAVLNIGQVLTEAGMPLLLVRDLARQPAMRRATLRQALSIQLASALVTAAGVAALTALLPAGSPLRPALWWIAASWPFYAVLSAGETIFQAAERMELVLGVEGAINLLTALASIGVLWQGGDVVALAAVVMLAQVISALAALWLVARGRFFTAPQAAAPMTGLALARRALPFLGLALADVLLQRLDILLVGLVSGATVAGLYSAAYNLLRVAVKLIQSVWRAIYPTLSRLSAQAQDQYRRLATGSIRYGVSACVGLAVVTTATAREIVTLLYGADFPGSAPVLRVLIWIMPLFFLETAAVTQLLVQQRARGGLVLTALHVAALALMLPPGTWLWGAVGSAWAALAAQGVGVLAGVLLLRLRRGRVAALTVYWPLLPVAIVAYGAAAWLPMPWPVRGAVGLLVYGLGLIVGRVIDWADLRRAAAWGA